MDFSFEKEHFWNKQAECIDWFSKWDTTLNWNPPHVKWFEGGKLNASFNCLDRHLHNGYGNKVALLWEGENGEEKAITYRDLFEEVNRFSCALKELGIKKGDRVAIYLPLIPEAVIAMLSCARIGAIHTVVFAGFSAHSLRDRILDSQAKLLITADGGYRRGKIIPLKATADQAVSECPCIESVIVIKRTLEPISMSANRDYDYDELVHNQPSYINPEEMEAEDPLYILYTSGTTGKPKGIIHSTGGYMVGVTKTMQWVFDVKDSDVFWCTADIGWVTGHSYVVYGPLSNGLTIVLYEGSPDFPNKDRFWHITEKYRVTTLYTAPTAIRMFMKWGKEWPARYDLSSLRILGSVGEPINPEAWQWYHEHIGRENCPIVDTWWQTETGSIMIAPIPGQTKLKPGSASHPLPGIELDIINDHGQRAQTGYLIIKSPWPSMLRGIYNDHERYVSTYWKNIGGHYYFTGDGAERDEDGYYWILGRVDDVINVSGHRLSTMEIESAILNCKWVAESAAVAIPHAIKGQSVVGFVSLKENIARAPSIEEEIIRQIIIEIGSIAKPEKILFVSDLPKTTSGKIMRRLLRDIADGKVIGDVTTLANASVIDEIKSQFQKLSV